MVVLLHGFSGTGDQQDLYLGLSARVSKRGFILVTPNGSLTPQGTRTREGRDVSGAPFWNATDACCDFARTGVDDVAYLARVIAEARQKFRVDPSRIYVWGHSNGGFMANRLSCEIGEQLAAVANLAGGTYKDPAKCRLPVALPYLHIHARDDKRITYGDHPEYAGARATLAQWLKRNQCRSERRKGERMDTVTVIPGKDTVVSQWLHCDQDSSVELWTIRAFESRLHNPHIPAFRLSFTDRVLDYLFSQRRTSAAN